MDSPLASERHLCCVVCCGLCSVGAEHKHPMMSWHICVGVPVAFEVLRARTCSIVAALSAGGDRLKRRDDAIFESTRDLLSSTVAKQVSSFA